MELAKAITECDLLWANCFLPKALESLRPHCYINHFPRSVELSHKHRLYANLQGCSCLPPSFVRFLGIQTQTQNAFENGGRVPTTSFVGSAGAGTGAVQTEAAAADGPAPPPLLVEAGVQGFEHVRMQC